MKLSFHLHLPSFKLFADDFNELSDAVDFLTLTAGFAMEQWREVQVKILIDGKTSHEDDTRLDTVILAVHGVIIRSFGEPVLRQQVRQSVQDRPDDILEKIRGLNFLFPFPTFSAGSVIVLQVMGIETIPIPFCQFLNIHILYTFNCFPQATLPVSWSPRNRIRQSVHSRPFP